MTDYESYNKYGFSKLLARYLCKYPSSTQQGARVFYHNMWQEFNTGISDNITEVLKIIDDALCYGFEFKVENHKIYFREVA